MKLLIVETNYADEFDITDTMLLTPEDEILWLEGIEKLPFLKEMEIYFGTNEFLSLSKHDILRFKIVETTDEVVDFLKKYRLTDTLVAGKIFDSVIGELDDDDYDDD